MTGRNNHMATKANKKDGRKTMVRVLCIVLAALLILSSMAAIFGVFG